MPRLVIYLLKITAVIENVFLYFAKPLCLVTFFIKGYFIIYLASSAIGLNSQMTEFPEIVVCMPSPKYCFAPWHNFLIGGRYQTDSNHNTKWRARPPLEFTIIGLVIGTDDLFITKLIIFAWKISS